jgi:hypothetical protein
MLFNLRFDRRKELADGQTVGYPGFAGFELEDGIYLLAPITWIGGLQPFFVAAALGACLYCLWTLWRLRRQPEGRRAP